MSAALSSFATVLQVGDGETPTEGFDTIAEITRLTPPGVSADTVEVTPMDGSGWKEFVQTMKELNEFSMTINYVPTNPQHVQLLGDVGGDKRNYKIVFPDAGSSEWAFAAFVTGFEVSEVQSTGGGSALEASVTFRPSQSAAPTFPS